jgi:hypothetical protein
MAIPKGYFHDRLILLLLTVNSFLVVLGSLLILLRLDPGRNEGYIVQNRTNLGISAYKIGHASDLVAFIFFMILILVINIVLSVRVYPIHRQFAVTALAMGLLLISLAIIVSNALLVLR